MSLETVYSSELVRGHSAGCSELTKIDFGFCFKCHFHRLIVIFFTRGVFKLRHSKIASARIDKILLPMISETMGDSLDREYYDTLAALLDCSACVALGLNLAF
jgi:hypothetical protein